MEPFWIPFGPFLATYVGRRNEMDAFWGHFFSIHLIFHWFYNRICVIRSPFLVGNHILARFYKGFWPNQVSFLCKLLIFHWFYNEFCPSSRHVFIKITFQQCFIRVFDKTRGRLYVKYWFSIGFTINSVHPHVMFS